GKVYSTANAAELLDLVRRENGWVYQTHPRTKGSTGYPDKLRRTERFLDPSNFGAGWKAMPSDLSSPRLGDRVFTLLDDMSNWGERKKILGEVDVFQLDSTHELYAHMNINYVRADRLPSFDNYAEILEPLLAGDFFVSTGEVLLPSAKIHTAKPHEIRVEAEVKWTLPLRHAEIVWGDGKTTHRTTIALSDTRPFGKQKFEWKVLAENWKWARLAIWDIAANGAFINPTWRN
ncbi:MAG: hypothetical protein GY953_22845, partial [bacterium]|nr:hypothetical protein [bacterium]